MTLKISRSQVSTQPNPPKIKKTLNQPNPWMDPTHDQLCDSYVLVLNIALSCTVFLVIWCWIISSLYKMYASSELVMGHFFKPQPNPTQNFWTQPTNVFTRPNPLPNPSSTIGMAYQVIPKTSYNIVTRHRQVHSQWKLLFSCSTH